jgi:hypothetical protein
MTAPPDRPLRPEDLWDAFIDALDRAGQAGDAKDVRVPTFGSGALGGRAFGELTRHDVLRLARVASTLGRREATIVMIWDDMQRRSRPPRPSKARRTPRS